jgi:hypothetical protein
VLSLLLVMLVFWSVIAWLSPISPIGGDSFIHYKYARYAFKYPELFLDHWGKPLYTSLSAPFAQAGYFGSIVFNLLLGVASAYFTLRTAKIIGINLAPLTIIMVLFAPIYSLLMLSAMTEVLFSFVLIFAVFLFFNKKYIWSAMAISFIPYVRTEGYAIIMAFAVAFTVNKSWKSIPFLVFGTVFYSLIGGFYYNDFFWVFTKSPYAGNSEIYGTGDFWFYLRDADKIFGKPIMIMIGIGSFVLIYEFFRNIFATTKISKQTLNVVILIFGVFFAYIFLQSFLWYKGMMAVLGSHRFMATIVPLGAIIALYWTKKIPGALLSRKWLMIISSLIIAVIIIKTTFEQYTFPYPLNKNNQLARDASDWMLDNNLISNKIWYADPVFFHFLNLDPFDQDKSEELMPQRINYELNTLPGDVIIWDAHFSANEGKLPLESLLDLNQFKQLKMFVPEVEFTVLGGNKYRIYIFEKTAPLLDSCYLRLCNDLPGRLNPEATNSKVLYFNSFEGFQNNNVRYSNNIVLDSLQNKVFSLQANYQHFDLINESLNRVTNIKNVRIHAIARVNPINFNSGNDQLNIRFRVIRNDKDIVNNLINLTSGIQVDTGWQIIDYTFDIDAQEYLADDQIKINWWYNGNSELLIDDVMLVAEYEQ